MTRASVMLATAAILVSLGTMPALAGLTVSSSAPTATDKDAPADLLPKARRLLAGSRASADNPLLLVDTVGARRLLEQAVLLHNENTAPAQLLLAKMMLRGSGGAIDTSSAVRLLLDSMQTGNGEAAFVLGSEYLAEGLHDQGRATLEAALRLGYYPAGLALAEELASSDPNKAMSLRLLALGALEQQAARGSASAALSLADYYRERDANATRALGFYERAGRAGDTRALVWIGKLKADLKSGVTAPKEALAALEAAATSGSVDAAREIFMGANSKILSVSESEAEVWLQRLLAIDDVDTELIYAGRSQTTADQRQALSNSLFDRLSTEPFPDLGALATAAASYRDGRGVLQDTTRALSLFAQGLKLGGKDMTLEFAKLLMGTPSLVTRTNTAVAYSETKALSDAGSSSAAVVLGDMLLNGFGVDADREAAIALYKRAAKQAGSITAMLDLARVYAADPEPANRPMAVNWYWSAISAGSNDALVDLADLFAEGTIVPRDRIQAIDLYNRGIDAGVKGALNKLVGLYSATAGAQSVELLTSTYNRAISKNYPDADVSFARFLIAQGHDDNALKLLQRPDLGTRVDVLLSLAQIYSSNGTPRAADLSRARTALTVAAQHASTDPAQRLAIAWAMLTASDVELSVQALAILNDLAASGYVPASTALGRAYLLGIGVPVDAKSGLVRLQNALAAGDPQARLELADAYAAGTDVGTDTGKAKALYEQALALAPEDVRANLGLGRLYAKKQLGSDNAALGITYLRKAAATGDNSARVALADLLLDIDGSAHAAEGTDLLHSASQDGALQAFADLASYHSSAASAPIDASAAFGYDYLAAQRNDVPSMVRVGVDLFTGFGTKRDPNLGAAWLLKAGELGSPDALYQLYRVGNAGQLGWVGRGEAPVWLKRAAEAGSGSAIYTIALELLSTNMSADHDKAVDLLKRAAASGHSQSKKMLGKLGIIPISEE